ncbi:biphenyl 2,3-dioxygenase [Loktanella sp. IMCC34160]|uniref:biphenyl 2,3-dioxygenase n=1 Tax=Loktanella sp. IMCC34160 TaxID=2510646 RepID=UPI00101C249D|nr:biphenyl 2,3-dioxygenase [Loktanella sp. IMCC34160]RYG93323.1 biphenyl 2,3-dioxygenase [Loktanella sp. IMCC34160]
MTRSLTLVALAAAAAFAAGPGRAEGDLSRANVIEVPLEMGSNADGMFFAPAEYTFVTGQAYVLVLTNSDEIVHELSLNEMVERIFTRKIEVSDADGNLVTEVKGTIREVEVGPGQTVEWFFVPVQTTDEPVQISCEIPGHAEAGMVAMATIN